MITSHKYPGVWGETPRDWGNRTIKGEEEYEENMSNIGFGVIRLLKLFRDL